MIVLKIQDKKAEEVVKEACWLAWDASNPPWGMGMLQDKPNATKEDVWKNVLNAADYPINLTSTVGEINADYVFGRMMKLRIQYTLDEITVPDSLPERAYQSWCGAYKTFQKLFEKAAENISATLEK